MGAPSKMNMQIKKPARGGKRLNAGAPRKDNPAKTRTMRLADDDYIKFINNGGVKWLRLYLNSKLNKNTIHSNNS